MRTFQKFLEDTAPGTPVTGSINPTVATGNTTNNTTSPVLPMNSQVGAGLAQQLWNLAQLPQKIPVLQKYVQQRTQGNPQMQTAIHQQLNQIFRGIFQF
jgi:hypothetical protein